MYRIIFLYFIFFNVSVCHLNAQNVAPIANFEANPTTVTTNGNVQLTDLSSNSPSSWQWEISPSTGWTFINSTNSNSQHPQLNFTVNGYYTVKLIVSNAVGTNEELKTNYIHVTPATNPCMAVSNGCDEFIQQVILNTLNHQSLCTHYEFSSETTLLHRGETYTLSVVPQIQNQAPGTAYEEDEIAAWIDFNGDFDFEDAGEQIAFISIVSPLNLNFDFTVPLNAVMSSVFMRVRMIYGGANGDGPMTPCGYSDFGEVEDYKIQIGKALNTAESALQNIALYPNPSTDFLTFEAQIDPLSRFEISAINGQLFPCNYTKIDDKYTISIKDLAPGIYFLHFYSSENNSVIPFNKH